MLLALSSGQKLGLALTAAVFIVFSLFSALLIPRYRPGFPGRGLGVFVVLTIALFGAMLAAVEVFAREEEKPGREAGGEVTTTQETEPATTVEEGGSSEAGKAVFAANGCGSCHTVAAAGSTGKVGPNLDESLEGADAEYVRRSIVDPNAVTAEGFPADVMPQNYGEQLSDEQLDDLVAFLLAG